MGEDSAATDDRYASPRQLLVAMAVVLIGGVAYGGYAFTRVPALVLARDAQGQVTLARERWVGSATVEPLSDARELAMAFEEGGGCRLVLRTAEGAREIARWGRRRDCGYPAAFIDPAARSLAAEGPFEARIPVTGSQVWWPLPLMAFLLVGLHQIRRRQRED